MLTRTVYPMDHEIGMILCQSFVLVGGREHVTLILWIEDHHRDVQIPEHRARYLAQEAAGLKQRSEERARERQ